MTTVKTYPNASVCIFIFFYYLFSFLYCVDVVYVRVADRKTDKNLNEAKLVLCVKNLHKSRDKIHVSYPTDRSVYYWHEVG